MQGMATGGTDKNFYTSKRNPGYLDRLHQRRLSGRPETGRSSTKSVCNLSDTVLNGFEILWRQKLMCDLVLTSQTKAFHVHKILLVTCSDYFYELLVEKKYTPKEIDFSDILPEVLEGILECMYTGKVHLTDANTENILSAATKLGFFIVKDVCEDFLVNKVQPKNCLRMLDTSFRFGLSRLSDSSLQLAAKSFKTIARRSKYKELPYDQTFALMKVRTKLN